MCGHEEKRLRIQTISRSFTLPTFITHRTPRIFCRIWFFLFLLACKADFVRIRLLTYAFWLVSITMPYMIRFKMYKYWIHDYLTYRNMMYPYVLFLHFKYNLNGYLLYFFFWFCIPSSNHENCILIQTHWNVVMSQKSNYRRKKIVNKLVVTMTCSS